MLYQCRQKHIRTFLQQFLARGRPEPHHRVNDARPHHRWGAYRRCIHGSSTAWVCIEPQMHIHTLHVHHMQCTCVCVAVCVCQYVTKNYCLLPLPTNHRRCVYAYAKKISNALRLRPPYLQDIVYWNLIDYSSNNFLYPKKESNKKVSKLKIELKPNDVLFCSSLPKKQNNYKNKTKTIRLLNEYEI